ncbi:S9 family peptidase [Barnesiella sp. CU968]|jgi:dipeptidyl aminopeptidase/acylaminoacyl peptidase|uniref:alpha/beta hydrolase family protein n=1 Tax=Barnesiella sp. CU968 TaxID=2780099 RepID=UPI00195D1BD0|nr:prolyl oligopeptidase family serine peptidase [Barnesiella sp. CU968]MBJ2196338.1 S9 family peptidase [Muribaculaceae bacterium]MCI9029808.1 S9 family peptidase [Muribaculaceae bacterium]
MKTGHIALIIAGFAVAGVATGTKKALDHTSFDNWKSVRNTGLSDSGEWAAYSVDPQEGDGCLYFYNTRTKKQIAIPRGYQASFTADGKWGISLVKAEYAKTRKAKIDKKKDLDLPQDSLAIVNLSTGGVEKIAYVLSYKIGMKGGDWIAFSSCDTTYLPAKILKEKEVAKPLVLRHLPSGVTKVTKWVENYGFDRSGSKIAVSTKKCDKDSLSSSGVGVILLPDTSYVILDRDKKFYGSPVFDHDGSQLVYVASDDSAKSGTVHASIYHARLENPMKSPREIKSMFMSAAGDTLVPNQYTKPVFSRNGQRLISGVAPIIAPDDTTIVDFENPALDIWRWDAPMTPPQELKNVGKVREKNYPVVIDLGTMHQTLVYSAPLATAEGADRWDGDWALVKDPTADAVEGQWNYFSPVEISLVNVNDGRKRVLGKVPAGIASLSPGGKYVTWFDDRNYYSYNISTGDTVNMTASMPVLVWNDEDDHPMPAEPWGGACWSADDEAMLIYDKFDIWAVDPQGKRKPECVTGGEGRKRNLRFRYLKTDPEERFVKRGGEMLLEVFDYTDKYNGLATAVYGKNVKPALTVLDGHAYTQVRKALDRNVYTWQRANFSESPDIWLCRGNDFGKALQLTDANPQMKDYNWGTAQLVKWRAYDGKESEGVLYVPENLDPSKKYPMLCVFYETGSEDLYRHYTMEPSWSWVNYPFYVSRGYVIFVPDIHYAPGLPGESCYNYVCSGAEEMCRRYPWIDKERIGIDGQSWGGYQTAYLVTRTEMFACAGSGAPVANMTSAFGGIRWESGDSRQAQYEQGQSRIGRNLWEAPELYIQNSPLFHADRVTTPLLIMHNDQDGAVPWYQGIEMFMALRRLQKPVWMLQYNGEAHNIRARKNRKDITVRLQQFFDHYLKGDPMPKWMKEGIPAVRKGQELGY